MLGFSKKTCLIRLRCYISDGSNENWVRKTSSKVAKWNVKYEKVIKPFCVLIAVLSPGDFKCINSIMVFLAMSSSEKIQDGFDTIAVSQQIIHIHVHLCCIFMVKIWASRAICWSYEWRFGVDRVRWKLTGTAWASGTAVKPIWYTYQNVSF